MHHRAITFAHNFWWQCSAKPNRTNLQVSLWWRLVAKTCRELQVYLFTRPSSWMNSLQSTGPCLLWVDIVLYCSSHIIPQSASDWTLLLWWNILGTWHPWKMSLETARVAWACASASPIPEGGATSQYRWKAPEHTQAQTLTSLKKLSTNKKWKQGVQNTNNITVRTCPNVPKTNYFFLYKKEEQETAKKKRPWTQIQETLKPQCSLHCLKSLLNPFRTKSKGNMKEIEAQHFRSYSCLKSKKRGVEGKTTTTKIIIKSPVQPPQPEISGFS